MLTGILVAFHVIACLTLILFILLQVGRGHGLSGASFGASGVQTVFGTKTVDFLSKMTATCAVIFVITCISLDLMQAHRSKSLFSTDAKGAKNIDMEKLKSILDQMKAEEAKKSAGTETAATATAPTGDSQAAQSGPGSETSGTSGTTAPAATAEPQEVAASGKPADGSPTPKP